MAKRKPNKKKTATNSQKWVEKARPGDTMKQSSELGDDFFLLDEFDDDGPKFDENFGIDLGDPMFENKNLAGGKLLDLLSTLMPNDKTVMLPLDHGMAIPVNNGLSKPVDLFRATKSLTNAFVMNYGMARIVRDLDESAKICLRLDLYKPAYGDNPDTGPVELFDPSMADWVDADAVMQMLYTNHPKEAEIFQSCARNIQMAHEMGLPFVVEALPFGIGRPHDYTVENIDFCVRAASELGADIVKTAYPGDKEGFRQIVENSLVPVIVLGGAKVDSTEELLNQVADAVAAGASGVAIGRNVWQHPQPRAVLMALRQIVHHGSEAPAAIELLHKEIKNPTPVEDDPEEDIDFPF